MAPLVLVTFALAEKPDDPTMEILCVGRDLGALGEEDLADLLRRARPFARADQREAPYAEPRGGRGRGR
jgi:hypothetical protein